MGDILTRDIEITALIAIVALLLVLPLQLLLCFKVKRLFLRLLPSLILTVTTIFLFILTRTTTDWTAIGYAVLTVSSAILLVSSGIAWGIWAIAKLVKRTSNHKIKTE